MQKPLYCCPDYIVDSDGFILSKTKHKPMKPSLSPGGYYSTSIRMNGKTICVPIHSAVAKTFLGDKTIDGLVVNHIDGDKTNNKLENLEWVTIQENTQHAVNTMGMNVGSNNGNSKEVYGIDKITKEVKYHFMSLADAARYLHREAKVKTAITLIWSVIHGLKKSYKGCIWTYDAP